ncbi:MAG: AEC family transporter [Clostridiales bacterium]|jgi:predicted permease|nr:AEC family transporter [Clostridiales bacterium]
MDFFTTLINVALLIALAVPGYILRKCGKLPDNSAKVLTVLLLYACQPFLTISSFIKKEFETALLVNMGVCAALSLVVVLAVFLVSKLCFAFSKDSAAKKVAMTAGYMNNCSFMGLPLIMALFPGNGEPIIYCAVFILVFNILAWTLSVYTMTGDKRFMNAKKAFLNPPTLALAVALPIFFAKLVLPVPLVGTIDFLGNMTPPLSMLIMGVRLADIKLSALFRSGCVYLSSFVKLVVSPLFTFALLMLLRTFIPISDMLFLTLYIIMAMPTAATVILLSQMYDADADTATKCVLLSSVFCVFTIPVMMLTSVFI